MLYKLSLRWVEKMELKSLDRLQKALTCSSEISQDIINHCFVWTWCCHQKVLQVSAGSWSSKKNCVYCYSALCHSAYVTSYCRNILQHNFRILYLIKFRIIYWPCIWHYRSQNPTQLSSHQLWDLRQLFTVMAFLLSWIQVISWSAWILLHLLLILLHVRFLRAQS